MAIPGRPSWQTEWNCFEISATAHQQLIGVKQKLALLSCKHAETLINFHTIYQSKNQGSGLFAVEVFADSVANSSRSRSDCTCAVWFGSLLFVHKSRYISACCYSADPCLFNWRIIFLYQILQLQTCCCFSWHLQPILS